MAFVIRSTGRIGRLVALAFAGFVEPGRVLGPWTIVKGTVLGNVKRVGLCVLERPAQQLEKRKFELDQLQGYPCKYYLKKKQTDRVLDQCGIIVWVVMISFFQKTSRQPAYHRTS